MIDRKGRDGETLLTAAIKMNDVAATKNFLDLGANPDTANGEGVHPLSLAFLHKNAEIFRLLIEADASVHIRHQGRSMIELARDSGIPGAARVIYAVMKDTEDYVRHCQGMSIVTPAPPFPPDRSKLFRSFE